MVGALVDTGVIELVAEQLVDASGGDLLLATVIVLIASFILSGLVDNIPYVAAMAPIVGNLVADFGADGRVLWWALALGSDLGGNSTAVGAGANVVVLGIAAKRGAPISFWEFTKYGLVITALSMIITLPYLWLRYFVLA